MRPVIFTAREALAVALPMPLDLRLVGLTTHEDHRGDFTELFREVWNWGPRPLQWNLARSKPNVLRGVHTHREHSDYLVTVSHELILGLHDTRRDLPTFGLSVMVRLQGDDLHMAVIPPGVSHGFYFPQGGCHLYGVSEYFTNVSDTTCRWDDPALGLEWPCEAPLLSPKDAAAGSYQAMLAKLAGQGVGVPS